IVIRYIITSRIVFLFIFFLCFFFFFFFFSSRRRHTRFKCDWSSDVCSSDLSPYPAASAIIAALLTNEAPIIVETIEAFLRIEYRSEERRVGKECRCGWWADQ